MIKVTFLIDGFNLYHSILQIERDFKYRTKWLDIKSLCKSYLPLFGKQAKLKTIFYFSAIPFYLNNTKPHKIIRHQNYISCLKSTDINIELGRFKEKTVFCHKCRSLILKHEEKETDVAIGIKLFEIFFKNTCNIAVIVTGDTDLAPAVKKCQILFPNKKILFAFPYKRKNKELSKISPDSFSINYRQYIKHQFSNPVILKNGHELNKPSLW